MSTVTPEAMPTPHPTLELTPTIVPTAALMWRPRQLQQRITPGNEHKPSAEMGHIGGKKTRESGGGVSPWSEGKVLTERSRCVPVSNQQGRRRQGEGPPSIGEDFITGPSGSSPKLFPTPDLSGPKLSHLCWLPTQRGQSQHEKSR